MFQQNNAAATASGASQSTADAGRKCGFMGLFLVMVMGFSILFSVSVVDTRNLYFKLKKVILEENDAAPKDKLLPTGFDENSCLSRYRYQSLLYRRAVLPRKPSPYLISKLRGYEARHKKCGPYTDSYNKTVELLKSGSTYSTTPDCKYIVWISLEGLGNKMLTLASAFLYALLTDRVLLADRGIDIPDLFCEPFPQLSWFLPLDFPLTNQFNSFNQKSNQSYGNLLKTNSSNAYIYLHLVHDYDDQDKLFFCDQQQTYLHTIPWLIMKSDIYIVPSFFLMPSFEQELHSLFPEKETVFHLLGRYLFHPTNSVWGLITRYHEAYLSKADEIIGIQVRVFNIETPVTNDQILSCLTRESILPLPQISQQQEQEQELPIKSNTSTVAVLMASLSSVYFERVRDMYWENPTATGEVVAVFQPSHEVYQQTEKHNHNQKALAEIYLLSLTDKLVTTGWSTFGYMAQSLGGMKPWILHRPESRTPPDPPCQRAMSIEPCFHFPPYYDCKMRRAVDPGTLVPHVRHCEDVSWGLKLV